MYHNVERCRPQRLPEQRGLAYRAWDNAGNLYHVYRPRIRTQVWSAYGILGNANSVSADTLRQLSAKLDKIG